VECFNFGAELDVLRGENRFADDDRKLLSLGAIVARDSECGGAGYVLHGNREQSKAHAGRLGKKLGGAAIERCRRKFRWASETQGFAELYGCWCDGAFLRERRDSRKSAEEQGKDGASR
jgi:hypothetical protein